MTVTHFPSQKGQRGGFKIYYERGEYLIQEELNEEVAKIITYWLLYNYIKYMKYIC